MLESHAHHRAYVWLLVALLCLAGFSYATYLVFGGVPPERAVTEAVPRFGLPASAPQPTPSDYVEAQQGFQYLVSYTDRGFEPATLTIKNGERVRFTNNSSGQLKLVEEGTTAQTPCSPEVLNSCRTLGKSEYWEYTFTASGVVRFSSSLGVGQGSVTVQ